MMVLVETSPGVYQEKPLAGNSAREAKVETGSGSTWAYGTWPKYVKYPFNSGSSALAALLTLANISIYHIGAFTITRESGAAGETISVIGTYESGNSDAILVRDASSGNLVPATALGPGTYYIDSQCELSFDSLEFIKSGSTDAMTVKGHLRP